MKAIFETLCGCKREVNVEHGEHDFPSYEYVLPLRNDTAPMVRIRAKEPKISPMRVRHFELVRFDDGFYSHEVPCAYYMEMQNQ